MKKLMVLLLAVMMIILSACSQKTASGNDAKQGGAEATGKPETTAGKKVTIEFWYSQQTVIGDQLQKLVDSFNSSHPNIEVKGVNQADGAALSTKLQADRKSVV